MIGIIKSVLSTHDSKDRILMRCECGELFWEDAPQDVLKCHDGHRYSAARSGTFWEFIKMKVGWIR